MALLLHSLGTILDSIAIAGYVVAADDQILDELPHAIRGGLKLRGIEVIKHPWTYARDT